MQALAGHGPGPELSLVARPPREASRRLGVGEMICRPGSQGRLPQRGTPAFGGLGAPGFLDQDSAHTLTLEKGSLVDSSPLFKLTLNAET